MSAESGTCSGCRAPWSSDENRFLCGDSCPKLMADARARLEGMIAEDAGRIVHPAGVSATLATSARGATSPPQNELEERKVLQTDRELEAQSPAAIRADRSERPLVEGMEAASAFLVRVAMERRTEPGQARSSVNRSHVAQSAQQQAAKGAVLAPAPSRGQPRARALFALAGTGASAAGHGPGLANAATDPRARSASVTAAGASDSRHRAQILSPGLAQRSSQHPAGVSASAYASSPIRRSPAFSSQLHGNFQSPEPRSHSGSQRGLATAPFTNPLPAVASTPSTRPTPQNPSQSAPFSSYTPSKDRSAIAALKPWEEIPWFSILTGENGSGKTQLLRDIVAQKEHDKSIITIPLVADQVVNAGDTLAHKRRQAPPFNRRPS